MGKSTILTDRLVSLDYFKGIAMIMVVLVHYVVAGGWYTGTLALLYLITPIIYRV